MNPRFEAGIPDFMEGIPDFIENFENFVSKYSIIHGPGFMVELETGFVAQAQTS